MVHAVMYDATAARFLLRISTNPPVALWAPLVGELSTTKRVPGCVRHHQVTWLHLDLLVWYVVCPGVGTWSTEAHIRET